MQEEKNVTCSFEEAIKTLSLEAEKCTCFFFFTFVGSALAGIVVLFKAEIKLG